MYLQVIPPPTPEPTIAEMVTAMLPYAFGIAILILILRPFLTWLYNKLRGQGKTPEGTVLPWKNEPRVPSILLQTNESYSELKRVDAVSGEFLYDPFDKKRKKAEKEEIYTGLPARTIIWSSDVFPTRVSRFLFGVLFPFGLRMRLYHRLYNEPCTRDLFTGNILLPSKKTITLVEKGVIDKEGYYLENGERKIFENCWIKPDFSDVDFIKSEFHAYKQSNAVVETARAMRKTGQQFDRWFFFVLIGAFVAITIIVFIMSGVGP